MDLRHSTFRLSSVSSRNPLLSSKIRHCSRTSPKSFAIRSSLPFLPQKAKYHKELEAAVDVVQRACRICVDVQKSLFSADGRVVEKSDNTPVTIADFSVQALISLELKKLSPLIPLVAEEDSAFLRTNNLADAVVNVVNDNTSINDKQLTDDEVLDAIDRGGSNALAFDAKPATYWVLDPIDGTRGFLQGGGALYVVGLALIVEGEIVLGVMGCPNWPENSSSQSHTDVQGSQSIETQSGIIAIAHVGCGTWTKRLSGLVDGLITMDSFWERCVVSVCSSVQEAHFCISDGQTWDSLPFSDSYSSTTTASDVEDKKLLLHPICCGSLSKYLMVASGRASVFVMRARVQKIIKTWDHAVGMICVCEAGGKVTDWAGGQLDLAIDEVARRDIFPSGGILVTNGTLHGHMLELVSLNTSVVS